jgi:small basic protein (TIGR04137 family)
MSLDKSLKGQDTLMRHRNVLTRAERIERLKETGRWSEDSKAIGLPKVAHRKAAVGKKDKAEKKQQTEVSEETTTKEEEK